MNSYLKFLGSVSPYCKAGCNCPGYLISRNHNKILLDCGSGIVGQMHMPVDLQDLTIIISHYHKDHFADLFSLGYASYCYHRMGLLNKKIVVYIPEPTLGTSEYDEFLSILKFKESYFDIKIYNGNTKVKIDDNNISFFEVKHSITSYSCKVENPDFNLVYTGDMGYKNVEKYVDFCKDADCLISEATYLETDNVKDENHLHAFEAANIAKMANVQTLILTHFWPEHNKLEYLNEAIEVFDNTIVAEEGSVISLYNKKNSFML